MKSFALIALVGSVFATMLGWAIPLLSAKPDRFQLALRLLDQGVPDQAVHLFQRADWRGVAQYRAQRYRRALGDFLQRENVTNLYNLGNAYARLKEWTGAKAAYESALRLDPSHEDARFNLDLVTRAEALELKMVEDSRSSVVAGSWKDGNRETPAMAGADSDNVEQGVPEGGAFRPAEDTAEATGKSDVEGRSGDIGEFRNAQAGIASGPSEQTQSEGELTGASASLLLRQSRQNAELLLRAIVDKPARVLRARLATAHRLRSGGDLQPGAAR